MAEAAPAGFQVVDGLDALDREDARLFIVLGVFDGLHRGHQYLLRALRREARRRSARPAVVTFDAHPEEIIEGRAPAVLCDPEERLVRFARAGVEIVVIAHFDARVRATPYDEFVRSIRRRVDLAGFLMTPGAAFGYERGGTVATVGAMGAHDGFDVAVVPDLMVDGRPVSSSTIRDAVRRGDLLTARRQLGRSVAATGLISGAGEAGGGRLVTFDAPVALPPAGRYRARVEPAPSLGRSGAESPAERTVRVVDGGIVIERPIAVAAHARVRIAFRHPA